MRALHTAALGMMAQELNVEVISNNIANMRTNGFKKQRADFQDLIYQDQRRVGSSTSSAGTIVPAGVQIGAGVKTAATPRIMSQGNVVMTEKQFDVAIRGEGYFQIERPDGSISYTRDGAFQLSANGTLVNYDGLTVMPGITVPENTSSVSISSDGVVSVILDGETQAQDIGQIELARFVNRAGLQPIGDNQFKETDASGTPQLGAPNDIGFGNLLQGYVEQANVTPVTELSDLIAAQRAYEMNARVVSSADEMLSSTAGMLR